MKKGHPNHFILLSFSICTLLFAATRHVHKNKNCVFSSSELNKTLPQKRDSYKYHASEEA
jgi:hypothetical protein